jgi:hypothetical protein
MKKSDEFKNKFGEFKGEVYFEILNKYGQLSEVIEFIDVPEDRIETTYYFVAECGCCTDSDKDTDSFKDYVDFMEDIEFKGLCEEISKEQGN